MDKRFKYIENKKAMAIKDEVIKFFKKPLAFTINNRKRELVFSRQVFYYMMRKHTRYSYESIGRYLAHKDFIGYDHSNVLYGAKNVSNLTETDYNIRCQMEELGGFISKIIKFIDEDYEWDDKYFINLNDCISAKIDSGKSVVFQGWSIGEVKDFVGKHFNGVNIRLHTDTNMYIIEEV